MKLKITDALGRNRTLQPRVELYTVSDYMGREMPGLAIVLDEVNDHGPEQVQYTVLTVSFGEFIGARDCAYIDVNNCPFADQLLKQGIAKNTGLTKSSGFCEYPLWVFNREFLEQVGGANYRRYAQSFDDYMRSMACAFGSEEDISRS